MIAARQDGPPIPGLTKRVREVRPLAYLLQGLEKHSGLPQILVFFRPPPGIIETTTGDDQFMNREPRWIGNDDRDTGTMQQDRSHRITDQEIHISQR